jgi:membrane protein YqaA with SNARE-associated domain
MTPLHAAMELASLFGIAFVSGVFWVCNAETTSAYYVAELGWNPVLVALVCTAAQATLYALLFRGGAWLTPRWGWLSRLVARIRSRYGARLETHYLSTSAASALIGVPPLAAMATLAQGFSVPLPRFLAVATGVRFLRFLCIALAGAQLTTYLHSFWP